VRLANPGSAATNKAGHLAWYLTDLLFQINVYDLFLGHAGSRISSGKSLVFKQCVAA